MYVKRKTDTETRCKFDENDKKNSIETDTETQ